MKIVTPETPTTLLLDLSYMPFGLATAKGAFYSMLKRTGKGIDARGMPFDWDQMVKGNITVAPDQPCMRSAPKDGKDTMWPIPTIVACNHSFFYKARRQKGDGLPSLREVYDYFRGTCCFCGHRIKSLADASREHIHSRVHGGTNHAHNITLAHRSCNSLAGSAMPKLDKDGNEITEGMRVFRTGFYLPRGIDIRPEWKAPLFLDDSLDRSHRG